MGIPVKKEEFQLDIMETGKNLKVAGCYYVVVGDVLMLFLLFSGLCQNQIRIGCTPDFQFDDKGFKKLNGFFWDDLKLQNMKFYIFKGI
jgi:hypothetical protein